jgi:hypothetical protein
MYRLPNFFIIGVAKSGTTSLYHYLKQHPEIYMSSIKEPKFFLSSIDEFPHNGPGDVEIDKGIIKTWREYLKLFSGASVEKRIGEASCGYLYYYEHVAPLIKRTSSEVKIIALLRNPIERAFSAYCHLVRDGRETLSFEEAIEIEEERKKNNYEFIWFYKDLGFYYSGIKAYLNTFGEESIKVCLYDDFKHNPLGVIKDIFRFLEVGESFVPDVSIKYNVSQIPKNKFFQEFLSDYNHPLKKPFRTVLLNTIGKENTKKLVNYFKNMNLIKMGIKPKTRRYLVELYRDNIVMLQNLIKRDLSDWLK